MSETLHAEIMRRIESEVITTLMFIADQDEMMTSLPEGMTMADLDSFTVVQLVLSLEDAYAIELLEDVADFKGHTFDHLAARVADEVGRARPDEVRP